MYYTYVCVCVCVCVYIYKLDIVMYTNYIYNKVNVYTYIYSI